MRWAAGARAGRLGKGHLSRLGQKLKPLQGLRLSQQEPSSVWKVSLTSTFFARGGGIDQPGSASVGRTLRTRPRAVTGSLYCVFPLQAGLF